MIEPSRMNKSDDTQETTNAILQKLLKNEKVKQYQLTRCAGCSGRRLAGSEEGSEEEKRRENDAERGGMSGGN